MTLKKIAIPAIVSSFNFQSISLTPDESLYMTRTNFGSMNTSKFAVSLWFYRNDSTAAAHGLVSFGDRTDTDDHAFSIYFANGASTGISIDGHQSGTEVVNLTTTTTYSRTEAAWHHMLMHFNANESTQSDRLKIWVDGTQATLSGTEVSNGVNLPDASSRINIGALNSSNTTSNGFGGLLYQVGIFWGAANLPTISEVYNSGAIDISGVSGLQSLLPFYQPGFETDFVLSADWTEDGTINNSTNIPSNT